MLMGIDIRYPDFEEEYWKNKEHEKLKEAYDKLEKKSVKINIPKNFVACDGVGNTKEATRMFEFDIFKIMYPVVEERDERLERFFKCHMSLLDDYEKLEKKCDELENKNFSKYDALEQKYWDAQRTIDKYAAENEELKKQYMEASNKMNLYKYQSDRYKNDYVRKEEFDDLKEKYVSLGNAYMDCPSKQQYENCKKDLTRWREMYYDLQKERDELENKLLDTEDKLEETERELKDTKRYLEGYQSLYIEEVLKHKESADKDEDKTLDIYDLEDCDGKDDDNKS